MLLTFKILFLFFGFTLIECVEISLPQGKIQGRTTKTNNNFTYYAFQEIPYAAPPIGNLRFKEPTEPKAWEGVLDTTKNTKICRQKGTNNPSMETEDCLYLNVYTPVNPSNAENSSKSVLFFLHGGGFQTGSSRFEAYGPQFLIEKDIVIVTANYRIGVFGFLSTMDEVIPGNYGLKDQQFALKWVNKNIKLFGGDPEKVTIMGQSAGGASVSYQLLSKNSKGLYRGAICQSGSSLSPWAFQRDSKQYAYKLATAIDSTFTSENDTTQLLSLLQNTPAEEIEKVHISNIHGIRLGSGEIFDPVIEKDSEDAFITDFMYELFESGNFNQVPTLIGINSEERLALAGDQESFKKSMAKYDNDIKQIVNVDYNVTEDEQETVGNLLRSIYTNGSFQDDLGAAVQLRSDADFTTGVIRQGHLESIHTSVYFYRFSYDGKLGNVNIHIPGAETVAHTENNRYVWATSSNIDLDKFPENDVVTSKRFIEIITNFVKYLNPTPEQTDILQNIKWAEVDYNNFQYLDFNTDLKIQQSFPRQAYSQVKHLYDEYGNRPFDTY